MPSSHTPPTSTSRARTPRTQVDNPIGRLDDVEMVLDVDSNVRCGVRGRRPPDWRLVDVDHVAEEVNPLDRVVRAREHPAIVEQGIEPLVEVPFISELF